jgi:hypothetical protein
MPRHKPTLKELSAQLDEALRDQKALKARIKYLEKVNEERERIFDALRRLLDKGME